MRVDVEPMAVLQLEEAERNPRVQRRGDGGALSDVPRGDAVRAVCGWCSGPVGLSGECERACDRAGRQERRG